MSDKDISALKPLAEKASDDSSWIGQTSRAAMLAMGLFLSGVGLYDAVDPETCETGYETEQICSDNVDGDPTDYLFLGLGSILAARLKIKRGETNEGTRNG